MPLLTELELAMTRWFYKHVAPLELTGGASDEKTSR